MSALSHQSAINPDKNFWLSASANGTNIPYNTPLIFDETSDGTLQGQIKGSLSSLYVQSPLSVSFNQPNVATPTTIINTDATAGNGYPGVYTSTIMYAGAGIGTGGLSSSPLTMNHRDSNNNVVDLYRFYMPQNDVSYVSSIGFLNYSSKDNFAYNTTTSPVYYLNPYATPEPTFRIPTYTLSTTTANITNAIVSTVNGTQIPANASLIVTAQPVPTSPQTLPNAVTSIAIVNPVTALVPGGIYSYDIAVSVNSAVANNAGSAPTYPYNILFGIRLGGNGSFDYGYVLTIPSAGGIGAGNYQFNLSGMTECGNLNQAVEIVAFQAQPGTTATVSFGVLNDPNMYLHRVG